MVDRAHARLLFDLHNHDCTNVVVYVKLALMEEDLVHALGIGQLAFFVGRRLNEIVLERLRAAGHQGVRMSHGYLIQHLVEGDRSVTELARRMGVTQQAASKAVADLAALGYVEGAPNDDARVRIVRLSARGRSMLDETRRIRKSTEAALLRGVPESARRHARHVLVAMLERLGEADTVRGRRVRENDGHAT
jgi:DNA-binding MarR family transcriptional regulator